MFFVIGLGNPGRRYAGTRHNTGFEVVEHLAARLRMRFTSGRGDFLIAEGVYGEATVALVKPLTFMNESGIAVTELRTQFDVRPDQLLVVCDDFQIPLGQLRFRLRGSDGGHNGLYSIIYHLQSDDFPRLRCGIGSEAMPADKAQMAEFVLDPFTPDEQPVAREMVERAATACVLALKEGIDAAMNAYNRKITTGNNSTEQ